MSDTLTAPRIEAPIKDNIEDLPSDPVAFLSIQSINALRAAQDKYTSEIRSRAIESAPDIFSASDAVNAAVAEASHDYDEMVTDYLKQFIAEDDPKFEEYKGFLRALSVDMMNDDVFVNGDKRGDGTYDEEAAGWKLAYTYRKTESERLATPDDDEVDEDDEDEPDADSDKATEVAEAIERMNELSSAIAKSRKEYAEALARRSRKLRSGGKSLETVNEAESKWRKALEEFTKAYSVKSFNERPTDKDEREWRELTTTNLIAGTIEEYKLLELAKVTAMEDSKMGKFVGFMNNGGFIKRMLKGAGVGVVAGIATIPLGLAGGFIGAGAIVAGGAVGIGRFARSFAGWQGRKPSARDNLATDVASLQEAAKKDGSELSAADLRSLDPIIAIQRVLQAGTRLERNRDRADRKALRRSVAVGAGAVIAGALVSVGMHALDHKIGVSDWVKDHVHGKKPAGKVTTQKTPAVKPAATAVSGTTDTPPVAPVLPPSLPSVPNLPPGADFNALNRLVNAHGNYPWNRAVDFFHGDKTAATNWINDAAKKAGAVIHNPGTSHEWLQAVDPQTGKLTSDTDGVWRALTAAALKP